MLDDVEYILGIWADNCLFSGDNRALCCFWAGDCVCDKVKGEKFDFAWTFLHSLKLQLRPKSGHKVQKDGTGSPGLLPPNICSPVYCPHNSHDFRRLFLSWPKHKVTTVPSQHDGPLHCKSLVLSISILLLNSFPSPRQKELTLWNPAQKTRERSPTIRTYFGFQHLGGYRLFLVK
jgi:hypothetical protein